MPTSSPGWLPEVLKREIMICLICSKFLNLIDFAFLVFSSFLRVLTYLERCGRQFPAVWHRSGPYCLLWSRVVTIWLINFYSFFSPCFSILVEGICYFWQQIRILHVKVLPGLTSRDLETWNLHRSMSMFFANFGSIFSILGSILGSFRRQSHFLYVKLCILAARNVYRSKI